MKKIPWSQYKGVRNSAGKTSGRTNYRGLKKIGFRELRDDWDWLFLWLLQTRMKDIMGLILWIEGRPYWGRPGFQGWLSGPILIHRMEESVFSCSDLIPTVLFHCRNPHHTTREKSMRWKTSFVFVFVLCGGGGLFVFGLLICFFIWEEKIYFKSTFRDMCKWIKLVAMWCVPSSRVTPGRRKPGWRHLTCFSPTMWLHKLRYWLCLPPPIIEHLGAVSGFHH